MRRRTKWFGIIAVFVVSGAVAVFLKSPPKPVDQQIMAANSLEFLGEAFPLDGGSRSFSFYLPRKKYLVVKVLHRSRTVGGGNPDFQEILVQGYGGNQAQVAANSELEKKLVSLLRSAAINTNNLHKYPAPAKPERLAWIIERIQDRKSEW